MPRFACILFSTIYWSAPTQISHGIEKFEAWNNGKFFFPTMMMTMTTNNTTIAAMKYIFFRRIEWSDFARMCQIGPGVGLVIWLSIEQSCIRIMGHCVLRWLTYKVMSRDHFLRRPLRCNQTTFLDGATFSKKRGFFFE